MNDREIRELLAPPDTLRDLVRGAGLRPHSAMFRSGVAPARVRAPHPMLSMRWYWKYTGRVPNTSFGGVVQQIQLLQEGYTAGLLIRVSGVYDIAAGGSTLLWGSGYRAIDRFQINPPGGASPWDLPGWETKLFNMFDRDFAPFIRGIQTEGLRPTYLNGINRNTLVDEAFPNAAGVAAQAYSLWFFIPFHRSAYDLRGILPTGTDDVYTLRVFQGAIADVFATAANVSNATMLVDVYQLIYDPPAAGSLPLDQRWLYTVDWAQNPSGAVAVSDYSIKTPKKDAILQDIVHTLILNNALDSNDVNLVTFVVDGYFVYNRLDRVAFDRIMAGYLGLTPPLGVFYFPWDRLKDADGSLAQFDSYYGLSLAEWIDQAKITTTETRLNITGGVAGTSAIRSAARRLTRVA